jgi:hypothetical protein
MRPLDTAPKDGTPVRLVLTDLTVVASWWTVGRSWTAFGPGAYRPGWFLVDDDSVEVDRPQGWEPNL